MLQRLIILFSLILVVGSTGCQLNQILPTQTDQQTVWISKDLDLKQCEPVPATILQNIQQLLQQNHINVINAQCVSDGLMRTQICGASQGKLAIYEIPAQSIEQAKRLGFSLTHKNQFQPAACS